MTSFPETLRPKQNLIFDNEKSSQQSQVLPLIPIRIQRVFIPLRLRDTFCKVFMAKVHITASSSETSARKAKIKWSKIVFQLDLLLLWARLDRKIAQLEIKSNKFSLKQLARGTYGILNSETVFRWDKNGNLLVLSVLPEGESSYWFDVCLLNEQFRCNISSFTKCFRV